MRGLREFVPGGYPLPWNPITLGEFLPGGFPVPQNPVAIMASSRGSLPKAPDLPMSAITHGKQNGVGCCSDCGMGATPNYGHSIENASARGLEMRHAFSSGVGAFPTWLGPADTIIPQTSLPTILQGDAYVSGVATVYLALGGLALAAMFMSKKR